MLAVGLTGGIGAGKSTVAAMLAEHGALVIDADAVAREVVVPGTAAHAAIVARFGPDVVSSNGELDRAALARVVFADAAAREDLNAIVHPAIGAAVDAMLQSSDTRSREVVVMEVPLLVEVGWDKGDVVVVVDCPEDAAVSRLVNARGMAGDEARRRMASQATREQRLARADFVVENAGSLDDLRAAVDHLWRSLAGRTAAGPRP